MNLDPDANPTRYGGELIENKFSMTRSSVPKSMFYERLRRQLAETLANDAVEVTEDEFHVTYRMCVYVMTPSQFERAVQRRAELLHPSRPSPMWIDASGDMK